MRNHAFAIVLALALAAIPVSAAEVVYFTNGSQLPVAMHWIEDGMLYVDLGGNGFMAFPEDLVETIDTTANVQIEASSGGSSSRGVMTAGSSSNRRERPRPPRSIPPRIDQDVETDKYGMAVRTPLKGQGRAAEKLKQYVLPGSGTNAGQMQRGGIRGTQREGNHHVIDSGQRMPRKRMGVERRYGGN